MINKKYLITLTLSLILIAVGWLWFNKENSSFLVKDERITLIKSSEKEIKSTDSEKIEDKNYKLKNIIELLPFVDKTVEKPAPTIVNSARKQIGKTVRYDPKYVGLSYPNGDVPKDRGVCTDVVIRALRDSNKIDLQKEVHEDMKIAFSSYPKIWGAKGTDKNIDHRRVPNLKKYFKRKGYALSVTKNPKDYRAGDIVTCKVQGRPHIMIVSSKETHSGTPYVIHNIGRGTKEENKLFSYLLDGHYRIVGLK